MARALTSFGSAAGREEPRGVGERVVHQVVGEQVEVPLLTSNHFSQVVLTTSPRLCRLVNVPHPVPARRRLLGCRSERWTDPKICQMAP